MGEFEGLHLLPLVGQILRLPFLATDSVFQNSKVYIFWVPDGG